jgi:Lrp/AsnC family leucine-responsive transcriptional regulator
MDETDKRIIAMLLKNSRVSYVDLGKELGLSRVAARERVKNLLDKGIIQDFTITLNLERMGQQVSAFFNIEVEPFYLEAIAEKLARDPNVVSIYQMTGPSNLHVHAVLKDKESLEQFIYRKLYAVKGIKKVDNQILLRRFKSRGGVRP